MSKTMLVNVVNEEESRIAIVADGLLEELSIETARQEQIEGNIYKARIVKVIPSLDAAFVDYGRERNGFLAIPDIHPQYFSEEKRSADGLRKNQDLMVQVKKGEIGQKGAALTTYLSLPGRYFVLMPQVNKRGVSRRIQKDATRAQLRKILDDTAIPEEMGYIARTAAEGRTKQELTRDANYLLRLWKNVQSLFKASKGTALLYQETDIVIRTLRDYFTPAIDEVLVDDPEVYQAVRTFFQAVMPWHTKRVRLHQARSPLFSKYNLEDQIATIYEKKVPLPSGGSLVIEQTEALVSIDVNSGKTTKGKDIEETALIANKEAAVEAARQLRLRDMGGLVVIDFIDMRSSAHRNDVRKTLQKALKEDKARTETSTISKFGLLELSRQRIKGVARAADTQTCPVCSGAGKVRSTESAALAILRRIQLRLSRKGVVRQVLVGVPMAVGVLLQNRKRNLLTELESRNRVEILVFPEPALAANQYYLEYRTDNQPQIETNLPAAFNRSRMDAPSGLPDAPPRPHRPTFYALGEDGEAAPDREVPDEPQSEAPAQPSPEASAGKEPAEKRRRRRRKKGAAAAQDSEAKASAAPSAEGEQTEAPGEQTAANAPQAIDGEPAAHPLSPSAKRRLRRKRAAAAARAQQEAQAAANTEAPSSSETREATADTGAEPKTGDDVPAAKSTEPKTSDDAAAAKSTKAKTGDEPAVTQTAGEEPSADTTAAPAAEPTPARRPRRPRRPRAASKPVAAETDTPPADAVPATTGEAATAPTPEPSAGTAGADTAEVAAEPKPKPKRAPRKPRARKPKAAETSEATETGETGAAGETGPAADATAPTPEATSSEDKPAARKRAPRKTTRAKKPVSETPPDGEEQKEAPAARKPARRTRKPATAAAKAAATAPSDTDTAGATATADQPAGEGEAAPAPKRRARPRKSTAAKKTTGDADTSATTGSDEGPPDSGSSA